MSLAVSLAAVLCAVAGWAGYLATIPRGTVAARPIGWIALQFLALALATASVATVVPSASVVWVATIASSTLSVLLAGMFLFVLSQRKTPVGRLAIAVGDELVPFTSRDSDGTPFDSGSLAGRRVLLKFFRGGW